MTTNDPNQPADTAQDPVEPAQQPAPPQPGPSTAGSTGGQSVARASAWMALGTIVSRITGFGRLLLIAVAIGALLNADLFNNANTLPNTMYILVAGGIFNVVLVPQLVRAMSQDDDGGDAYAQRIISLGLAVLAVATLVLMALVPLLMRIFFAGKLFTPGFEAQRESAQFLMWLCLPQVFFYGAFVLVGQVLNARRRFGPMMWAPIVNNLLAMAMLGVYIAIFGRSNGEDGFSTGEVLLLGLGSTVGIVAQFLVLLPYLRSSGFTFRWRTDWRGVGLSKTLKLGVWTLLFIVANQIAYVVVQRLGTRGTLQGAEDGVVAAGTAVYEIGFLVSQLPHGVITVSLATAMMPTLASLSAQGNHRRMRLEIGRTVRVCLTMIAPAAVAVACLGSAIGGLLGVFSNLEVSAPVIGSTISAFSLAMIAFTVHYLMLRGFYADEDTRTPFWIQTAIAATNIAVALVLVHNVAPGRVAASLALSYGLAYTLGAVISTVLLSRRIGSIVDGEMIAFALRLAGACAAAAAAMLLLPRLLDFGTSSPGDSLLAVISGGLAGIAVFLVAAFVLRMRELNAVFAVLRR